MPLTKLQKFLSDVYSRIILSSESFDPEQETHDFLIQAGQTPEAETNQRYLQLIRTLRHEDFNVRSNTAKFLCIICYQNFPLQRSLRTMLPLTILASNLIVFNLPVFYDASMLANLQKNVNSSSKKSNAANVFWSFPKHYITNETLLFTEPMDSQIEDMLKLNIDPLYQFIGSITISENIRQPRVQLGPLERRFTAHFSTPIIAAPEANKLVSRARRITMRREFSDPALLVRPMDTDVTSTKQGGKENTDTFESSTHLYTERSDNKVNNTSSTEQARAVSFKPSIPDIDNVTPKFQEELRSFWMPDGYDGEPSRKHTGRKTIKVNVKNRTPNKSVSQAETGLSGSPSSSYMDKSKRLYGGNNKTLLDLLEITPNGSEAVSRASRKNNSVIIPSDSLLEMNFDEEEEEEHKVDRPVRARSFTPSRRVERVTTQEFIKQTMKEFCSEMSRETFRLLKQDRHDMYADYDEHVERLGLRPYDKKNFTKKSFDPQNVLKKKVLESNTDRKKAFLEFLTEGHKEKYTKEQSEPEKVVEENYEGIKANTYYGRKWMNELSRVRLSNFGKKEDFMTFASPTVIYARPSRRKDRLAGVHKKEVEKVMDRLQLDVASSNEKFVSNIIGTNELAEKVFGEDFKKYLDVLNYERAIYNVNNGEALEKAYELVDLVYEAKQRSASTNTVRKPPVPKQKEPFGPVKKKEVFMDEVYQMPAKQAPRSKLFLRKDSDEDDYHNRQGDRMANIGKLIQMKKKVMARKKRMDQNRRTGRNHNPNHHNLITETTDMSAPPHNIYESGSHRTPESTVGSHNSVRGYIE